MDHNPDVVCMDCNRALTVGENWEPVLALCPCGCLARVHAAICGACIADVQRIREGDDTIRRSATSTATRTATH